MRIAGLQKVSLIDYPGYISAVVFTQGCNFRCPYCHNPELVDPRKFEPLIPEKDIYEFLKKRIGKLDGVVITGGEPTIQRDLADFIQVVKDMGYRAKLDTNGASPEILNFLVKRRLVDYIAMDIKSPLALYQKVVGVSSFNPRETIKKSIKYIMASGVNYEFRTTVVKSMLGENDLQEISEMISGATLYILQTFKPTKTLKKSYSKKGSYTIEELEDIARVLRKDVERVITR